MGMTTQSADQLAQKWASNLGSATQSIRAGVQAVTVSPTQKAAAAQQQYLNGVQQAVASGKWARGLQRVTLASWQDAMLNKGLNRIAGGASAAIPKMTTFLSKWMQHMSALQQKLASTPRGDLQANIQRAIVAIQHNASFQYT